jgi:hypothetical protein
LGETIWCLIKKQAGMTQRFPGRSRIMCGKLSFLASFVLALGLANNASGQIATNPVPADGSEHEGNYAILGWSAGAGAASHNVYFGDNLANVQDGTGGTFVGNQTGVAFLVGFWEGLVPGTTYYWRIDEVNDLNPNSPWIGQVWSFTVIGPAARHPNPPDADGFVDLDVQLSWSPGYGAITHDVYFGDNLADVEAGTGGTFKASQSETTFMAGPLEPGNMYYWRIDEFDGVTTHQGEVWSFSTSDPNEAGVKAEYFAGITPHGAPCLTQIELSIDHNWGNGEVACGLSDQVSASWMGNLEIVEADTYTFTTNSDDGVRVWLDGSLIIDNWTDHAVTTDTSPPIQIEPAIYSLRMEWYENTGDAIAQLFWETPTVDPQIIPPAWLRQPAGAVQVIDDFESYTDDVEAGLAIFQTWIDGIGFGVPGDPNFIAGDGTGAVVGYRNDPNSNFVEQTIVYRGYQSMPLFYDHSGPADRSEATANIENLAIGPDWTVSGVTRLSLWFYGDPCNAPEPMYVAVADSNDGSAVVYHDDPNAPQEDTWTEWVIPLQAFADQGVNLADVNTMAIGLGIRGGTTTPAGSAKMYTGAGDQNNSNGGGDVTLFANGNSDGPGRVLFDDVALSAGGATVRHVRLKGIVRNILTAMPIPDANVTIGGRTAPCGGNGDYGIGITVGRRKYDVNVEADDTFLKDYPGVWVVSDKPRRDFVLTPVGCQLSNPVYCFQSKNDSRYFYTLDKYISESDTYQIFQDRGEPVPSERDALLSDPDNWTYKGIAFGGAVPGTAGTSPVHRFRHRSTDAPSYALGDAPPDGEPNDWTRVYTNVFHVFPVDANGNPSDPGNTPIGAKPVRRLWHENLHCYSYTIGGDQGIVAWYAFDCCWSYPRQCHGDADSKSQGRRTFWVSTNDLDVLIAAWNKTLAEIEDETLNGIPLICADFDHKAQGREEYRVSTNDLDILIANWNIEDGPAPDCP